MAAITLLESSKTLPEGLQRGVIQTYASTYHPLMAMPIETSPTGVCAWSLEDQLPTSTFRNVNGSWTASVSQVTPYSATSKIAGGRVQVDRFIQATNPMRVEAEKAMQIKSMAKGWTSGMFQGAGGTYLESIDYFIDNVQGYSGQNVDTGTASAGALLLTDHLDSLLNKVNVVPGKTFIYMPDNVGLRARKISRGTSVSGDTGFNMLFPKEQWGTFSGRYDEVPIVVLKDGKGTDLLDTISGTDDSSVCVYAVTYGTEAFCGFQVEPMKVVPQTAGDVYSYFDIEWYAWCAPLSVRSIARLRYVENATA